MQADHAEDLASIREQARRLLQDQATPEHLKSLLNESGSFDKLLWGHAVEQGWTSVAVPESAGGLGLGWSGLAVICEELGRLTGSLPLITNTLAVHALLRAGPDDHQELIDALANGAAIASLALADPSESGLCGSRSAQVRNGRLNGEKALAAFAAVADVAVVQAGDERGNGVYLVRLDQPGVQRRLVEGFDNSRAAAVLQFIQADVIYLGGAELLCEVGNLAALATAFEQIGGTQACLDMACDYARERRAFGQLIGGFQGIKHKLAEIYCLLEIARGCASDALDAWEQRLPTRQQLTSAARIAAIRAYNLGAQENLHVHGGMGVTWEAMPHHYYRRSRSLALELGSLAYWRERLLADLGLESATALAG
ncbi:Acyl-CoA dehydrogenase FadE27 [compost metagenome]|jgi:alkylation response protein AidB-like acyl-CoA dehydrogenase|uniref:acyl-CoA dehydrogenase family protein n=1 Tax=Metapseudomonas furukawaii TaxID=1149133 RepID=UPI00227CA197|nr:acyl-CoA dehydrogenase family protein [Pseudomonas furukawaii]WAG81118.1 acyl-CoA/acyl-ACP dehydrogenase [Pseudomonas furukawaii]